MHKNIYQKFIKNILTYISKYLDISFEELLNNIHLYKNELDKKKEKDLNRRSDYVAYIEGSFVNIEVNNNKSVEILERNMEYAHRLYARKVKRREEEEIDEKERMVYTQVIQLNLNNFSFEGNNKIVDIYYLQNNEQLKLSERLIFIQIYIPNLIRKWYTHSIQELEESERYLLALVLPSINDSLEVGTGVSIMKEYIEEAIEVCEDDDLLESYDKEWALKEEGRDEGREEGLKEGREEGLKEGIEKNSIEIAKSLLEENIPLDTIIRVTKLPKEKILSLQEGTK